MDKKRHKFTIKALILAAGLGTRLRPYTLTIPKCLMPINGEPLLGRWLNHLDEICCKEVIVNTHYLANDVEKFISHQQFAGMRITCSHETELLGTGGTLWNNRSFFQKNCDIALIIHADNFMEETLHKLIDSHINRPSDCILTMLTFRTENPSSCGIVQLDCRGVVTDFKEKQVGNNGNLANGALYAIDPGLISDTSIINSYNNDISRHVLPLLVNRIYTYETVGVYDDIGTPESYHKLINLQQIE